MIVFGGHGVFGSILATELGARPVSRRDGTDVADAVACRLALEGHAVAVDCAGPFGGRDDTLLRACLDAGCHYVDIADDRAYCARVHGLDAAFRAAGLAAVTGCSSLPGISGALLDVLGGTRHRVTLFIGQKNPKGDAAVASFAGQLERFRGGVAVDLPEPFGRRRVYPFASAHGDGVDVRVGFESRLATAALVVLARLRWKGVARALARVGGLMPGGHGGGTVLCEDLPSGRQAYAHARTGGQRMAVWPAVLAARALAADGGAGATTVAGLLGARTLLDGLAAAGFDVSA